MEDSGIIKLLTKRSETAVEELLKKYRSYMYSISFNILKNREDAACFQSYLVMFEE